MRMILVLTLTFLWASTDAKVPSYFKICGRRDPKLDECILSSVKQMESKIRVGIPELDIPSSEPMIFDEIVISDSQNFKASAANVRVTGFWTYVNKYLHVDLENQRIDVEIFYPKFNMDADYNVNARIVVPVIGKGPIHINATGVTAKVSMKYNVIERRGEKYMFFTSVSTKLTVNDYTSEFTPEGGLNDTLRQAINSVLGSNKKEILDTLTPNLEQIISKKIIELSNKVCKHFPYNELFPDRE